ncbi:MAG: hypothetical protein A2342_09455 [Gallionellales bacterium RIFOXYB12_FULL_54_9]|nr:MAG: hypothetical protein A2342_09455 [Gallionellales bacterium RIFOXYB12_FULL_54_9]
MRLLELCLIVWFFTAGLVHPAAFSQDRGDTCRKAIIYKSGDFAATNAIKICSNAEQIPVGYKANIDMPVCDDTLCANVILKFYWDLAGNYTGFDTIPGKPLTKFDHKKFQTADYLKLNQILKNRNSILRILEKEDLVDKTIKIKATTVDAITGATPQTIKNAVVEGAVYTSFTLWHFVNGAIKDSIAAITLSIYSEQVARQMLISENYETQLFALRKWTKTDYELHFDLLFQVIRQSVPLIKAYAISKSPLPFVTLEKNRQFVSLYPLLDAYSKSIFLNRITAGKDMATVYLPLMMTLLSDLDQKQLEQVTVAVQKFEIPGFQELKKNLTKPKD